MQTAKLYTTYEEWKSDFPDEDLTEEEPKKPEITKNNIITSIIQRVEDKIIQERQNKMQENERYHHRIENYSDIIPNNPPIIPFQQAINPQEPPEYRMQREMLEQQVRQERKQHNQQKVLQGLSVNNNKFNNFFSSGQRTKQKTGIGCGKLSLLNKKVKI